MSKLINLYNILSLNVRCLCLLSVIVIFSSFTKDKTDYKIQKVVIDPGHGGRDPGTMGTKRYSQYEKDIALAISLKLGNYIKYAFPEIEIIYTRDTDVFLELWERTELANKENADLFISIHCDGFTNPDPFGPSVFVMGMSKLKANMDVAMRENAVIYLEDNFEEKYDGFDPKSTESYIVFSLMQNTFLDQSILIAEKIEEEFANTAKRKSRGVKQAPFYVISRVNMPSILIESGFLTNPEEEDFLNTKLGQDHIATAIFRGFKKYKKNVENISFKKERKVENYSEVIFKVQVATYLESMLNDKFFDKIKVQEKLEDGIFKYYVGGEIDKNSADLLKFKMRKDGFKGAFVVPFYNEKRISMKEALDIQMKKGEYE